MSENGPSLKFVNEEAAAHGNFSERSGHLQSSPLATAPALTAFPTMVTSNTNIDSTPYRENLLILQSRLAFNRSPPNSKRSIPVRVSNSFGASLALQQGEREKELKRSLEIEYRDLSDKVTALNRNLAQLGYRKVSLKHNISDTNSALNALRLRLDSVLQAAEKSIGHAKQMAETHLDEFLLSLEDLFAKLKFNLNEQVASARGFRDEGLDLKVLALEKEFADLEQEASDLRRKRDNATMKESEILNLQLEQHINTKQQQCDALEARLQQSEVAYAEVSSKHVGLTHSVSSLEEECLAVEDAVRSIESRLATHTNTRRDLLNKVALSTNQSMAAQSENQLVSHELDALKRTNEEFQSKLEQYESHRQILENSIMDHEGLPRVYARGDSKAYPEAIESFNKVFSTETSDEVLASEYKHLIGGIARGRSVSVIYLGGGMDQIVQISQCYNHLREICGKNACITLQCFIADDDRFTDPLNQGKLVSPDMLGDSLDKIPLQAMIIREDRGSEELAEALQRYGNPACTTGMLGYILQVTEKGSKGSVLFLSLSELNSIDRFAEQTLPSLGESLTSLTKSTDTRILSRVARYAMHRTQCLFLADLNIPEPHSTLRALCQIRHCN